MSDDIRIIDYIQYKVLVVGSGPAGLTASIYLARAGLIPLVVTGDIPGGQLVTTSIVENFPGFIGGIDGYELVDTMRKQAIEYGAIFIDKKATLFNFNERKHRVLIGDDWYEFESIILANGANAKWLGLENEKKYYNKGISTCAICDGPLPYYRNKILYVVGGGDSAAEEALFLTKFASKVIIIHRRNRLSASKILIDRVTKNEKIEILYNSVVIKYIGDHNLEKITIKNLDTNETKNIDCEGLFLAIGHIPNTKELIGSGIELDKEGYIITKNDNVTTSIKGVYAAGDVQDKVYRQAITAAGFGCQAALVCEKYLSSFNSMPSV